MGEEGAMKPYYQDEDVTLHLGDCRDVLATLPAESMSCVMTSPPFFGLRKYTCPPSIWGGDPDCPHSLEAQPTDGESYAGRKRWQHDRVSRQETPEAWVKETSKRTAGGEREYGSHDGGTGRGPSPSMPEHATCSLCGAWRGWLGLEPTVEMFVAHTIDWLRAVRRVMRKDGVLWLDIDDSRSAGGSSFSNRPNRGKRKGQPDHHGVGQCGIVPKNLCLIPQRIAIAAQDDGWIVRSEIIITSWMPESAKDRPTDACRKVLMLVKQKSYWYDGQAVRVEGKDESWGRYDYEFKPAAPVKGFEILPRGFRQPPPDGLRNLGSVWDDIPPAAYPDAHFATFAVEEPERCILASCPAEICVKCGKTRARVVKKANVREHPQREGRKDRNKADFDGEDYAERESGLGLTWENETTGWTDCGCGAGFEPGIVLDPFIGTGTTAIAARKLGRKCIGIDASEEYLQQAVTRLTVGDSGIRRMVEARRAGAEQGTLL